MAKDNKKDKQSKKDKIKNPPIVPVADAGAVQKETTITTPGYGKAVIPKAGEYVIFLNDKDKRALAQVNTIEDDSVVATLEKERWIPEKMQIVRFDLNRVLFNLGTDPVEGSIYGVRVELWRGVFPTKMGMMNVFRKTTEEEIATMIGIIDKTYEFLSDKVPLSLFPLDIEFRKGGGSIVGTYRARGKGLLDLMTLKPQEIDELPIRYNLCHELGHGISHRWLSVANRARWVRLYSAYIDVKRVKDKVLKRLFDEYMKKGHDFDPSEVDEDIWSDIESFIQDKHNLNREDLDFLAESKDRKTMETLWPDYASIAKSEVVVSEYALTNPNEFWCESLAFWMSQMKIPDVVKSNVVETMKDVMTLYRAKSGGKFDKKKEKDKYDANTNVRRDDETKGKKNKDKKKDKKSGKKNRPKISIS